MIEYAIQQEQRVKSECSLTESVEKNPRSDEASTIRWPFPRKENYFLQTESVLRKIFLRYVLLFSFQFKIKEYNRE